MQPRTAGSFLDPNMAVSLTVTELLLLTMNLNPRGSPGKLKPRKAVLRGERESEKAES
jgi:hypothetical protein